MVISNVIILIVCVCFMFRNGISAHVLLKQFIRRQSRQEADQPFSYDRR